MKIFQIPLITISFHCDLELGNNQICNGNVVVIVCGDVQGCGSIEYLRSIHCMVMRLHEQQNTRSEDARQGAGLLRAGAPIPCSIHHCHRCHCRLRKIDLPDDTPTLHSL